MNGQKQIFSTALLAGTLVIAGSAAAFAAHNDGISFREFRQQNSDIDRHAARALFKETYGNAGRNRPEVVNPADLAAPFDNSRQGARLNINNLNNHALVRQFSNRTRQVDAQGEIVRLRAGLDLDLTSNNKNITLGRNLFNQNQSIQISIGNETKTVSAGSQVTAAEYIAVKQTLAGGGQKLLIDRNGRAIGGDVDLDAITGPQDAMRAANLVVASNVTTNGDFSRRSDFKLLGNLDNFGTVLASSSGSARSGALRADDINNYIGASISSTVDLTLDASGSLNNAGTITSTSGLTLSAGKAVTNYGSINATGDLGLVSKIINNRGSIGSVNGNVNLNATDAALVVDNRRGTISALNGAINLRDSTYAGTADSMIVGGDLLSKQFNMHAGQGTATVDVNQLTGLVSQTGNAAHLTASTELLKIGDSCLTGDPTYFNTAGSILIDGNLTAAENLVIVASGNITGSGVIIQAGDATSTGFDITLIAGAEFTNQGGNNKSTLSNGDLTGAGAVSLSGKASRTGGNITLSGASSVLAKAITPGANANGGNVQMFAFDGKGLEGKFAGTIDLGNATVDTGGTGTGNNGNIQLVASAEKAPSFAIRTGTLIASGALTTTGSITGTTAKIQTSVKGEDVTYDANGVKGAASLTAESGLNNKARILVSTDLDAGNQIGLLSGEDLLLQGGIKAEGVITLFAGGDIIDNGIVAPIQSANRIELVANGNVGLSDDAISVTTPILNVFAGGTIANIQLDGVGSTDITSINAPKADISLLGIGRTITASGAIQGETFSVSGSELGAFSTVNAETASFRSLNGSIEQVTIDLVTAPNLNLFAAMNIGTASVTPLDLNEKATFVRAQAGASVFMNTSTRKSLTLFDTRATADVEILVNGAKKILVSGANPLQNTGHILLATTTGALELRQQLSPTGAINIDNLDNAGKIEIFNNLITKSAANISIKLGSTTATPMPVPAGVIVQGNVTLTGSGMKATAGTVFNGGTGSAVSINNGGKANNLTFGDSDPVTVRTNNN
jgi:filamentous hemagglutinin